MLDSVVELAVSALSAGKKLLVVGTRPSNLGKWHHDQDERLVFLSSDRKDMRRSLPQSVGLVINTRFRSHSVIQRIRSQMPGTMVLYKNYGTGQLKTLLEEIFTQIPSPLPVVADPEVTVTFMVKSPTQTATVTNTVAPIQSLPMEVVHKEEVRMKVKRGALRDFMSKNANPGAPVVGEEIQRLLDLAQSEGLSTTFGSVREALRRLKAGTSHEPEKARQRKSPRGDSAQLLAEFCKQSELVAVAVAEILEENKHLREQVRDLEEASKKQKSAVRKLMSELR